MKRIVIVRHAKSDQFGYDDDFNRNLTDRGINDADKISNKLVSANIVPDKVFSSPANRTIQTAEIYCRNFEFKLESIKTISSFYHGISTKDLVNLVNRLDNEVNTIFIFGHNPTVYYWVYNLVKYFNSDMPTCSTVVIDFDVNEWAEVSARTGIVKLQLSPKSI